MAETSLDAIESELRMFEAKFGISSQQARDKFVGDASEDSAFQRWMMMYRLSTKANSSEDGHRAASDG